MEDLFHLVEREGIYLRYVDLSGAPGRTVYGLYYRDPIRDLPMILLDHRVETSRPLHRSVLAEELGHHFTAPRTSVAVPFTSYTLEVELSRDERRALRWACDYLMPVDRFTEAVLSGLRTPWELAEHFEVTEWLVWRRLDFLRQDLRRRGVRARWRDVHSEMLGQIQWGRALTLVMVAHYAVATVVVATAMS